MIGPLIRLAPLFVLLAAGCVVTDPTVEIYTPGLRGHGVVVAPGVVRTVAHVVPAAAIAKNAIVVRTAKGSSPATLLRTIAAWPEPLVELKVLKPSILPPAADLRELEPGDSGRPVFDGDGQVIGLVSEVFWKDPQKKTGAMGAKVTWAGDR